MRRVIIAYSHCYYYDSMIAIILLNGMRRDNMRILYNMIF